MVYALMVISSFLEVMASRRQRTTVLSTTGSELIAACEAAREALWIQVLMKELQP